MADRPEPCPEEHLAFELALGELTGRARADALAHLLTCPSCRKETDELLDLSERILLAAPEAEPPAGFESAVVSRLSSERPPRRRSRVRIAVAGVAAALVAAVALGTVLAPDGGSEVAEARMVTPSGRDVGVAWHYESDPSWVFIAVPGWEVWESAGDGPRGYRMEAVLDDGTSADLGRVTFGQDDGTWAAATDLDTSRIRSVAIVDQTGHVWCEGRF